MDFLKQVSIEIYPEGASDEERKSYSKKYGAQMHALLDGVVVYLHADGHAVRHDEPENDPLCFVLWHCSFLHKNKKRTARGRYASQALLCATRLYSFTMPRGKCQEAGNVIHALCNKREVFRAGARPTFAPGGSSNAALCLRRPHFFQQRKKWGKERRQKPMVFGFPSAASSVC